MWKWGLPLIGRQNNIPFPEFSRFCLLRRNNLQSSIGIILGIEESPEGLTTGIIMP
jgi:hypothetical protein